MTRVSVVLRRGREVTDDRRETLDESMRLNVLERVTVFDTNVVSTLTPLPSPLETTFPHST